jgi:hypothetical protein
MNKEENAGEKLKKEERPRLRTYSEVMAFLSTTYETKNRPTLEQSMKQALMPRDNIIGVTYFRRSPSIKKAYEIPSEKRKPALTVEKPASHVENTPKPAVEKPHQQEQNEQKKDDSKTYYLTIEQINEIKTYPAYWRSTLTEAAQRGESIKEFYEKYKDLEGLM